MSWRILGVGLVAVAALVGTLALGLAHDAVPPGSAAVGRAAPRFALPSLRGGALVSLESLHGKPTVVSFWATWCEACREEHATLQKAARTLDGQVNFVGIALEDDAGAVRRFVEEQGSRYPILLDPKGDAASAFGVSGLPTTFFLDERGVVVSQAVGQLRPQTLLENLQPIFAAHAP